MCELLLLLLLSTMGRGRESRSTAIVFSGSLLVSCYTVDITLFLEIIATIFEPFYVPATVVNALHALSYLFLITTP